MKRPLHIWILSVALVSLCWSSTGYSFVTCTHILSKLISKGTFKRNLEEISSLKIATFNVTDLHQTLPSRFTKKGKSAEQLSMLGEIITESDADILVLQEVIEDDTLRKINQEHLNNRYDIFFTDTNDFTKRSIAFLVKKDLPLRIDLFSHSGLSKNSALNGSFGYVFPRNFPFIELRTEDQKPNSTPLITIFGTHLSKTIESDPERTMRRAEQINSTAELIQQYESHYPKKPYIVMAGDFNDNILDESKFMALKKIGLADSAAMLNLPPEDQTTHILGSKLDGIFVNSAFQDAKKEPLIIGTSVLKHKKDGKPIDHTDTTIDLPSTHFLVNTEFSFQPLLKSISSKDKIQKIKKTEKLVPAKEQPITDPKSLAEEKAKKINQFAEETLFSGSEVRLPDPSHPGLSSEASLREAELKRILDENIYDPNFWSSLEIDIIQLLSTKNHFSKPQDDQSIPPSHKYIASLDLNDMQKSSLLKINIPDLVMKDIENLSEHDKQRLFKQSLFKISQNPSTGIWNDWGTDQKLGSERIVLSDVEYRVLYHIHEGTPRIVMVVPATEMKKLPSRLNELK